MRFRKYHGLGNDFVVVDLRDADATTALAIQDPHKGTTVGEFVVLAAFFAFYIGVFAWLGWRSADSSGGRLWVAVIFAWFTCGILPFWIARVVAKRRHASLPATA